MQLLHSNKSMPARLLSKLGFCTSDVAFLITDSSQHSVNLSCLIKHRATSPQLKTMIRYIRYHKGYQNKIPDDQMPE